MEFESKIQGIPCIIDVTYYTPQIPATHFDPPEGGDFEYNVLDRSGRKAPWLQKKITPSDDERIYKQFMRIIEDAR